MPSTVIQAIDYDEETRTLIVTFVSDGDEYAYENVPPEVLEDFRAAPSRGRFFAYEIRDRYPYRKVTAGGGPRPPRRPPGGPPRRSRTPGR